MHLATRALGPYWVREQEHWTDGCTHTGKKDNIIGQIFIQGILIFHIDFMQFIATPLGRH